MKVVVIFSPRILLCQQLLQEVSSYLVKEGMNPKFFNVNTGSFKGKVLSDLRRKKGFDPEHVDTNTDPEKIKAIYDAAVKNGQDLIITSTYHSAQRIIDSGIPVDLQLNDEAHNLVDKEFNKHAKIGKLAFSFTATPKHTESSEGMGMNNSDKFGKEVSAALPIEMIRAGEMVKPALHFITSQDQTSHDDAGSIAKCIINSYGEHQKRVAERSANPSKIGAKLLISVPGQSVLKGVIENKVFVEFVKKNRDIGIYAISSGQWHDKTNKKDKKAFPSHKWESVFVRKASKIGPHTGADTLVTSRKCRPHTKEEFLDTLQAMDSTEKAIIIYVDMLGEGIDVPSITGFMPFRGLGDITFKQGVGRACRLFPEDKWKFYSGEMKSALEEPEKYIKPRAWVLIPDIFECGSKDYRRRYANIISLMVDEFDIDPPSISDPTDVTGKTKDEDGPIKVPAIPDKHDIKDIYHEVRLEIGYEPQIHHLALYDLINHSEDTGRVVFKKLDASDFPDTHKKYPGFAAYQERAKFRKDMDFVKFGTEGMEDCMVKRLKERGVFSDEIKKKYGTIYTPDFVVEKTLDLAFKYAKGDKLKLTWCDPAAGDGNFLIALYRRLMKEESDLDPIEKSKHILSHCIHGIEILKPMWLACKLRLMTEHIKTCDGDNSSCEEVWNNLNIRWGNAIVVEEDTKEEWYKNRPAYEGGILS